MSVLVIAEPGSTHEGRLDLMLRLIDAASDAGVNVFKSQWLSSAERLCERRRAPEYLDSYRKLEYPLAWHAECRDHAKARGLQYACSVYLPGDAALVGPFCDFLKVSSFEAEDGDLICEAVDASRARAVVSLGMNASRPPYAGIRCVHCVSSYPAPISQMRLASLFDVTIDGLSDHSRDLRMGGWAVCAGAQIIEAHLRLDDTDTANKDYAVAFTPAEFATYVQNIRDAELAMGDGVRRVQPCEGPMLRFRV
ncbi:MAG: N-acetylneuraminate synthase family protein [Acidobacteria bacterium]|nr:N-acetylneuraminate synthase family protein [Acidobacteriota bacterium]